jgi:hypothetical protein
MAEVQELRDEIAALQLTLKSTVVAAAAAKKDDSGLAAAPGLRLKFAAPPKFTGLVPAGRNVASELQWPQKKTREFFWVRINRSRSICS